MFDDIIQQASVDYAVPVPWIQAVIETESNWLETAYRAEPQISDGSYGLMQLLSTTARSLGFSGDVSDLYDPETNIRLGTQLLAQLRTSYGDDFRRVYSAYNSGNPDKWQTSSQVAANVTRAVDALEKWAAVAIGAVTASPATAGVGLLVMGVLLWAWTRRK